jgi:hypothetical protein
VVAAQALEKTSLRAGRGVPLCFSAQLTATSRNLAQRPALGIAVAADGRRRSPPDRAGHWPRSDRFPRPLFAPFCAFSWQFSPTLANIFWLLSVTIGYHRLLFVTIGGRLVTVADRGLACFSPKHRRRSLAPAASQEWSTRCFRVSICGLRLLANSFGVRHLALGFRYSAFGGLFFIEHTTPIHHLDVLSS